MIRHRVSRALAIPPTPSAPASTAPWPDRLLLLLTGALLGLCFVTGGSSSETGLGIVIAQYLAIPVALLAVARAWLHGRLRNGRWPVLISLTIVLLPVLQLLPIPAWLWQLPGARLSLQQDLAAAGVHSIGHHWSLAPAATARNALLLLPPLAVFLGTVALDRHARHRLLWWLLGLIVFSVLLAYAQIAAPEDSFLNPFPQYLPMMTGVFANKNHQAITVGIGLVLALWLIFDALRRRQRLGQAHHGIGPGVACAGLFVLTLPLVNSRAGVLIAMVGIALAVLASGVFSGGRLREHRSVRWLLGLALVILVVGAWGAFAWMQEDADMQGSRWLLAVTTWHLGWANAPLGSGFGSFVPMFEQATEGAFLRTGAYINNAHNDFVQWWLEGGVAALLIMLAAAIVLLRAAFRLLQLPRDSGTRLTGLIALIGVTMLLLHSTVDYPLRTPALMAVFALLAAIATTTHPRALPPDSTALHPGYARRRSP